MVWSLRTPPRTPSCRRWRTPCAWSTTRHRPPPPVPSPPPTPCGCLLILFSPLACVLFNDNRDNRDNFFEDFFKKRKIKGTIFYVLVLFPLTHKKLSLLSLKQKFPKKNCLYCLYCRLKPRYDWKRPSLREIIGCIFNSSTRSTTAEWCCRSLFLYRPSR